MFANKFSRALFAAAAALLCGCARQVPARPAPAALGGAGPRPPLSAFDATVERVVDGDTLIARRSTGSPQIRVRLIGIDSPETVKPGTPTQCYGPEASAYLKGAVAGTRIRAAYQNGGRVDRYGRDLWDIWLADGTFVAGQEVDRGYATALRVRPQVAHAAYLSAVEATAKAARRGLWGSCRR